MIILYIYNTYINLTYISFLIDQQEHGAYLLESESADVFQCSVGNITSGQTVVIKITYVTELKHDFKSEKI